MKDKKCQPSKDGVTTALAFIMMMMAAKSFAIWEDTAKNPGVEDILPARKSLRLGKKPDISARVNQGVPIINLAEKGSITNRKTDILSAEITHLDGMQKT